MTQPEHNVLDGFEQTLVDLGTQPLVNNLAKTKEEALAAERYPLKATIDNKLVIKLSTAISPDKLYKNYLYHSGAFSVSSSTVSMQYPLHTWKL